MNEAIKLLCKYEVYESEKIELKNGLREFLNNFMGGKYCNFEITEERKKNDT